MQGLAEMLRSEGTLGQNTDIVVRRIALIIKFQLQGEMSEYFHS